MRIFGYEITRAPKRDDTIWHRVHGRPRRITDLTPDQLRAELHWAATEMMSGNALTITNRWTRDINSLPTIETLQGRNQCQSKPKSKL